MPDDGLLVDFVAAHRDHAGMQRKCCRQSDAAVLARLNCASRRAGIGLREPSSSTEGLEKAIAMALDKPYKDVAGHDNLRRRAVAPGLSLEPVLHVVDEGREPRRFKADERKYLNDWPMSEEQKLASWRAT